VSQGNIDTKQNEVHSLNSNELHIISLDLYTVTYHILHSTMFCKYI